LVYVSDARSAGDSVTTVPIPARLNAVNPYYIAPLKDSSAPAIANEWVALVTSQAGQRVLRAAGFGPP
jgi:molybdate transport system substrate-binding protein